MQHLANVSEHQLLGERSVLNQVEERRDASVVATSDVVQALQISKKSYQNIFYEYTRFKKFKNHHYLKSIPFFKTWPETRLLDLNDDMGDVQYLKNDIVYGMDETSGVFYVVVEGKLVLETCIEIDTYNKFPSSAKEWKVTKKTKKYIYKLREVRAGDYFGHEEIILNVNRRI